MHAHSPMMMMMSAPAKYSAPPTAMASPKRTQPTRFCAPKFAGEMQSLSDSDDSDVSHAASLNSANSADYLQIFAPTTSPTGWPTPAPSPSAVGGVPPPPSYLSAPRTVPLSGPALPLPTAGVVRALPAAPPRRPHRHDPYTPQPISPHTGRVAYGISHQPLVGRCRYVAWPNLQQVSETPRVDHTLPRLVIDQVKFELQGSQLRWLIRELTGVIAAGVIELDRGIFAAYFKTADDARKVKDLNRSVLFDHNGAWCPISKVESDSVAQYMATREFRQRGQRLPRELMAVAAKRRPSE